MPRYKQSLTVAFDTTDDMPLYSGICYYRNNLSDNIEIRRSGIVISFERSKKDKPGELLNTQNSIIRYYLQKALCLYLAVEGYIPKVSAITFTCNDKTVPIEHESFTHHWEDCRADICLDPKAAGIIFESDKGKPFYIMMTHFLKAQLDNFSHDRFRSAWSSLNCLYTYIDALDNEGYRSEEKKLTTLANTMTDNTMPDSIKRVESLDTESFWKKLNWYNIFNSYSNKEFNRLVSGAYEDSFLLELICHYRGEFDLSVRSYNHHRRNPLHTVGFRNIRFLELFQFTHLRVCNAELLDGFLPCLHVGIHRNANELDAILMIFLILSYHFRCILATVRTP